MDLDPGDWTVAPAHRDQRAKVMVETPTGVRFYLDPDDALALGVGITDMAKQGGATADDE